jgi:hypothetical protein
MFIIARSCLMVDLGVNSIERSAQEGVLVLETLYLSFTLLGRYATRTLQCGDIKSCISLELPTLDFVVSSLLHRSYSATTSLCLGISPTRSRCVPE